MLAPQLEFHSLPERLAMGVAARDLYPGFAAEIEAETGLKLDLRLDGIVAPIAPGKPAGETPGGARRLTERELQDCELGLDRRFREGFFFQGDGSVDNRALVDALVRSCRLRGVEVRGSSPAEEVVVRGGRVQAVRAAQEEVEADIAVNCAGAWAGQIRATAPPLPIRPIKGQMLLLDRGAPPLGPPRLTVYSELAYLVPRSDGRVVVGTTVEDRGYDKQVEAGAVERLLRGALSLCPGLVSARFVEAWAGLRPLGGSELPLVGPHGPEGYFVAVGHYRNGILLAPLTARALADFVAGRDSFHTRFFTRSPAAAG
jgi:glycine/D-amino acid oxidase-like deaminating enzyme